MNIRLILSGLAACAALCATPGTGLAQIFETNLGNGTIGEYTTSGATVNASLVTGLDGPQGLAVSGGDLFVANQNNVTTGHVGAIGEYDTTSGATVNVFGRLGEPVGLAVSGVDLFVANNNAGTIGEYTTSGATVNIALVSGLKSPFGLAVSGVNLFVTDHINGTIANTMPLRERR